MEIGTGRGRTAFVLSKLFPTAKVYTIDLPKSDYQFNKLAIRSDFNHEKFKNYLNQSNIQYFEENSLYLPKLNLPKYFDLIWVDGGHNYPTVAWDLMFCYNKLNANGIMLMHDYNIETTDVKDAIDKLDKIIPEKIQFLPFGPFGHYDKARICWLQKD